MTPIFERAQRALQAGQTLEAEKIVAEGLEAAKQAHPVGSLAVAQARFDLASILTGIGDLPRAIEHVRAACDITETTEDARRDRLTFIMNLGEMLQRNGQLDQAEKVHRDGLIARADFYGKQHAGYAFGLEPLAEVMLSRGDFERAKPLLTECVDIFAADSHPRLPIAILLEASCDKARAPDEPSLHRLGGASVEELHGAVEAALLKAGMALDGHSDPVVWLGILTELCMLLVDGGWSDADSLTDLVAGASNLARRAGLHDDQASAYRWLIAHLDQSGNSSGALEAVLGLGFALSHSGDHEGAEVAYRDAMARASDASPIARSGVMRNFGLYLAEVDRRDEAAVLLEQAVDVGRKAWGGGGETLGRALVARGIFVQHGGELEAAKELLTEALTSLALDHPDALPARSHLDAISSGGGCGCGNMNAAISEALYDMVQEDLPEGLLESIAYEDDGNMNVSLARKPTTEEMALLDRVLHQARAKLQRRIRESS